MELFKKKITWLWVKIKKKSSVSYDKPLFPLLYLTICHFLSQNHCFLEPMTLLNKNHFNWFEFVYKFTSMHVLYLGGKNFFLMFHESFRNWIQPEDEFIYLFLAFLGLPCCTQACSSCREQWLLFLQSTTFRALRLQ